MSGRILAALGALATSTTPAFVSAKPNASDQSTLERRIDAARKAAAEAGIEGGEKEMLQTAQGIWRNWSNWPNWGNYWPNWGNY